jgi:formate hydrogenlyase subunit 3/multisubunit Na+/H+ antiporter MnhD subunit
MTLILNPLWLIVLPLGMAPVVYLLRREGRLAGLLAGATTLVAARLCLSMPFDWSLTVLGRELTLRAGDRMFLAFTFVLVTLLFVYAWSMTQGWSFFPFILIILSLFAASTMVDNTIIAILLLEMAATLMVLVIQAGRHGSVKAGLHYLVTTVLAIPPLLVAAHLSEVRVLNPDDLTLPRVTAFLLALGFGLILGMAPFQSWLFAVSAEAPTMVSAFLLTVGSGVVIFKLLEIFNRFPWLIANGDVLRLTFIMGLGSALLGGALAVFQHDFGRLLGWAALADMGFMWIALAPGSAEGLAISTLLLVNRWISVALVGMGMGILRRDRETDRFSAMTGIVWRKPFAVLALGCGGLSLAGFPLTAGFTVRWLAYQGLPEPAHHWMLWIILASAAVGAGYLRGLAHTVGAPQGESTEEEPLSVRLSIVLLVAVSTLLALYPQVVLGPFSQVMATLVPGA